MPHIAQERYSSLVDEKLRNTLVTKDNIIFNNRYEGDPKAGKVKTPVRDTEVEVKTYNKQTEASISQGSTAYFDLNIDDIYDIEDLQEIVRKLRKSETKANNTCGIHIHIGSERHTAKTLSNLVNIMTSKQNLIYKALGIKPERERYCRKLESELSEKIRKIKPDTLEKMADIWYDGYYDDRNAHYNSSRYHCLNLHSVFTKGTVEFRLFNSTTHAGKIKAYIQFCLAVNNQAITQKSASARITETTNPKYTFRTWLLRLGLIGEEFKTARLHLLANLDGNIAWRNA